MPSISSRRKWLAPAVALLCFPCFAERNAIRVTGSSQPGCWSVEDIVSQVVKGAGSDREKALALHRFGMAHFIHFDGPIEERGEYVTDPMKLIAVYGHALCGNNSSAMNALYNAAGLRARQRTLPEHAVPEVWFEGKWNYIDTDMFGYVFLPDGKLASVDELSRDPDLFLRQAHPPQPYYPFDKKEDMASVFRGIKADIDCHAYTNAHTMNLSLRTGESARLYFRPKGAGRYFLTPDFRADLGIVYKDYYLLGPVRKDSMAWCDRPPASYGNGLLEYAPDLKSAAFARENPDRLGVAAGRGRGVPDLVAATAEQTASIVVKVTTPWIIAGLQNDLTNFADNTEAAIVTGLFWRLDRSDENRILVSRDSGQTWTKVWENRWLGAVPFRVDLTRWAEGEYAYWVKFEWTDRKGTGKTGVERLNLRTWVELSPMALPRVVSGRNTFRVDSAPLRAVYSHSRWDRGQGLPGQRLDNLTFLDTIPYLRPTDTSKPGILSFPLGRSGEVRELRFSARARASHGSHGVAVALSLSEDGGATWHQIERFTPDPEHTTNHMWFNQVLHGQHLNAAKSWLKVAITGGGLEQVIANTLIAATPLNPTDLRVIHLWREGDQQRSFSHVAPRIGQRFILRVDRRARGGEPGDADRSPRAVMGMMARLSSLDRTWILHNSGTVHLPCARRMHRSMLGARRHKWARR